MNKKSIGFLSAALGAIALIGAPAESYGASDIANFYKVKGLRMVVGSGAGGG